MYTINANANLIALNTKKSDNLNVHLLLLDMCCIYKEQEKIHIKN